MGEFVIKMPDVGEGVAEAELVEWHVKPGDPVREDMVLAAVMTDKATVEIPSPVDGTVLWLGGEIGDTIAVKAPLVRIEMRAKARRRWPSRRAEASGTEWTENVREAAAEPARRPPQSRSKQASRDRSPLPAPVQRRRAQPAGGKPLASPAVRLRAQRERRRPASRCRAPARPAASAHDDIDQFLARRGAQLARRPTGLARKTATEEIKVTGLRRRIAEKMALSTSRIPHITYVEEVDITGAGGAARHHERRPQARAAQADAAALPDAGAW